MFLTVVWFHPLKLMHGLNTLSFLDTKKNPAPTGEIDGCMMPDLKDSSIYFLISWDLTDFTNCLNVKVHLEGDLWDNRRVCEVVRIELVVCGILEQRYGKPGELSRYQFFLGLFIKNPRRDD